MKNKANIWRLIGVGIVPVGIILCLSPAYVGGIIAVIVGIVMYLVATDEARKRCDACGKSMKGCAYSYQEVSLKPTEKGLRVTMEIRAECPHCGKEKVFRKVFSTGEGGMNIQYQVDSFCRNKFGH